MGAAPSRADGAGLRRLYTCWQARGTLSTALSPANREECSSRCSKKTTPQPPSGQSAPRRVARGSEVPRTAGRLLRVTAEALWLHNSLEDTAEPLEVTPAAVQGAVEEDHPPRPRRGQGRVACLPQPTLELSSRFDSPLPPKFQLSFWISVQRLQKPIWFCTGQVNHPPTN